MKYIFTLLLFIMALAACENSKEEFVTETYNDYMPLQIGKFITYRLDSLVFTKNGSVIETHKYRVKHTIQSEITDNQGRKAFLVNKLINNETGTGPWLASGNYIITPLADKVEVTENNLRIIKLHNPFKKGFSWKGNTYLPVAPYRPLYNMEAAGVELNQWQFVYSYFGDTIVNGQQYRNVWTVFQNDVVLNMTQPFPVGSVGSNEKGKELYAKGIGLVYKNLEIYERQPPNVDNPQQTYTGFGITMWMVEHN